MQVKFRPGPVVFSIFHTRPAKLSPAMGWHELYRDKDLSGEVGYLKNHDWPPKKFQYLHSYLL